MGAGKSTAAKYLNEFHGYAIVSFAGPLKEIAKRITPDGLIDKVRDRSLLQFLGADYFRAIDENFWVKKFQQTASMYHDVTNDDARFDNEFDLFANNDYGYLIYVDADPQIVEARLASRDGSVQTGIKGHSSEPDRSGIDDPRNFAVITNNGTHSDLLDSLKILITKIEINHAVNA
jgi:dephospho-CoA kinase